MGYCNTREASATLDKLDKLCRSQNPSSNVWTYKGKTYFYDITRKDQIDGGIRGGVHLCLPDNMAREVGRFNIDGDGVIVKFPGWPTDLIPKPLRPLGSSMGW